MEMWTKIWVDDVREIPDGYDIHIKSVNDFIDLEHYAPDNVHMIIDLDHDAGDYVSMGGDYIEILRYLERMVIPEWVKTHCVFKIRTANPPARQLMLNIIERNEWKYEN